jgi:hypothetical protein
MPKRCGLMTQRRERLGERKSLLFDQIARTPACMSEKSLLCAQEHCVVTMRSRREKVPFRRPLQIKGIDRSLPLGDYVVITDEEMIEGISFSCFRRVATLILSPGAAPNQSTMEMISNISADLSDAQRINAGDPRE